MRCNCLGRKGMHKIGLEGCNRIISVGDKIPKNQRTIQTLYGPIEVWDIDGEIVTEIRLFSELGYTMHRSVPSWSHRK